MNEHSAKMPHSTTPQRQHLTPTGTPARMDLSMTAQQLQHLRRLHAQPLPVTHLNRIGTPGMTATFGNTVVLTPQNRLPVSGSMTPQTPIAGLNQSPSLTRSAGVSSISSAKRMRRMPVLPTPGEGTNDVDPKYLSQTAVRVIRDTENSFMRTHDDDTVGVEPERVCPMCKRTMQNGDRFRAHLSRCSPTVYFEINRQQPMYFGSFEQNRRAGFWKDWVFPSYLEDAAILYGRQAASGRSGSRGTYASGSRSSFGDGDDSDFYGEDDAGDFEGESFLESVDGDDGVDDIGSVSTSSSLAHAQSQSRGYSMTSQPLSAVDIIINKQIQMLHSLETGTTEIGEEEDHMDERSAENSDLAHGEVYGVDSLKDLLAHGAEESGKGADQDQLTTSHWNRVVLDKSAQRYLQNASTMNEIFFGSLDDGHEMPSREVDGISVDVKRHIELLMPDSSPAEFTEIESRLQSQSREYWDLIRKLSTTDGGTEDFGVLARRVEAVLPRVEHLWPNEVSLVNDCPQDILDQVRNKDGRLMNL